MHNRISLRELLRSCVVRGHAHTRPGSPELGKIRHDTLICTTALTILRLNRGVFKSYRQDSLLLMNLVVDHLFIVLQSILWRGR